MKWTTTQNEQEQTKPKEVKVQEESTCRPEKLIKCTDSSEKIKIVKADMSNLDQVKCPATNVTVDHDKNVCESTRIQSTELAQKLLVLF